jgi:cytochrome c5
MNQRDDKTFIRRFSGIIIGLVVFTILIIMLAVNFQSPADPDVDNPSQGILAAERSAPIAAVRTGDDPVPAPGPITETAGTGGSDAPFDGSLDGELVYNNVCSACHNAGVAGAPIPGSTMNERADKGLDTLVHNAINGLNVMPPRGGNPDLTDEQVQAAVEYMLQ